MLDKNPLEVEPMAIRGIKAVETIRVFAFDFAFQAGGGATVQPNLPRWSGESLSTGKPFEVL
ncbi:hypothetical protein [Pseudomonas sp. NyZ201]|uniref:hypothetical protein n=1 Tax=Pseudomonas sp. NyZ201 TaxID=3409857 RepID=UPI003CEBC1CB